jgi:hypothetical protein
MYLSADRLRPGLSAPITSADDPRLPRFTLALRSADSRLTAWDDHLCVRALSLIPALLIVGALAAGASATNLPGVGTLPPGWSHVSVNVVIKRQAHTLTYDRGRVVSVSPTALVLREADGTMWTIAVTPATQVKIQGRPASIAEIRRLEIATTVTEDGGPAIKVDVQIPPGLAAIAQAAGRAPRRSG